jgi:hypothetical protein
MPQYLSNELAGTTTGLTTAAASGYRPFASVYGARVKRMRATINLAAQTTSDTFVVGILPTGATFAHGHCSTDTSLGSSTLAIGTAASTGKYRVAAVLTTTNAVQNFGVTAAVAAATPLAAEEVVIATIAAATLPSSGTLVVDLYYSMPN